MWCYLLCGESQKTFDGFGQESYVASLVSRTVKLAAGIVDDLHEEWVPDMILDVKIQIVENFWSPWKMVISEPKTAHLREVLLFAFNWNKSATEAH
ncbi:hypothetical protein LAZ67_4002020 [Cordylochernes scorpioides]|uniref:Uncharacterized protein n=1 Tax=Cordylochernes scorpioides TaxID=51811 RepID=A0ABY6KCH6_9ARAC|nr:hypothetical protein LAZ67_4002020 [Cordylochernes scorpioides]